MENRALTSDEEKYYVVGGTATVTHNDAVVSKSVEDISKDAVIGNLLSVAVRQKDNNGILSMTGADNAVDPEPPAEG